MKSNKSKKSKKSHGGVASKLKNFARGQVAAANSHAYTPSFIDRRSGFENGIREAALLAGRHLIPSQHEKFLNWLKTQSNLIGNPANRNTAVSYRGLSNRYDVDQPDFERQVLWAISRVQFDFEKIIEHEAQFNQLEAQILLGKVTQAQENIEILEKKFGATVRLAEVKLAFEQFYFGLEAQKKLATNMRGGKHAGLIGFLIHYMSMRNEPSMPIERHNKILSDRISTWASGAFRDYANFKLLQNIPQTETAIANVLHIEEAHSVFDLFDTLRFIYTARGDSSVATKRLRELISLRGLRFEIVDSNKIPFASPATGEAIWASYRRLSRNLQASAKIDLRDVRMLSAHAAALRGKPKTSQKKTLLGTLTHKLAEHLNLFAGSAGKNTEIGKLSINFHGLPLFSQIFRLVQTKSLNWLDPWISENFLFLDSRRLSTQPKAQNFHRSVKALPTSALRAAIWLTRLISDRRLETLTRFSKFATDGYKPTGIHFIDANVNLALCKSLIEIEELPPVWNLISSLAIDKNIHIDNIPAVGILRTGNWHAISKNSSLAKLGICIDIQSNVENIEIFDGLKRYALEDLLYELKIDHPSALTEENAQLSRKEYIYFLKNLCIPRTMELLPALPGTAQVNAERRAICSTLLQIDRENATDYNQEILNTIRRERVQQGLKLVDGSRIHVDTDVLAKKLGGELSVDFDRYKRLVAAGVGVASKFDEVLRNVVKPIAEQELLTIPENEADDLLIHLISTIRDRFLFDEMNGFDSYLGRRIRHNSMTGTMRAPLSQERITTKYDGIKGRYEANTYWLEKLGQLDEEQLDNLDLSFNQFSSSFDAVGNDIKTRLFQVRTAEFPDGIFYISLSSNAYHLLRSLAQQNIKLEEFVVSCFQLFWGNLSDSLAKARHIIRHDARNKIETAFNTLKSSISTLEVSKAIELTASIERSRQAVHKQLELIIEWFHKREINEQKSIWRLDEIIDICIEVCLVTHRARAPKIVLDVTGEISLPSESLFVLSDILWVAIDNACMHSGFPSEAPIRLNVNYNSDAKLVSLDIENDVADIVANDVWHRNIASISEDIETRRANESLRVEGRSGLKKVAAIAFSVKGGSCIFGPRANGAAFGISVSIPTVDLSGGALDSGEEVEETELIS